MRRRWLATLSHPLPCFHCHSAARVDFRPEPRASLLRSRQGRRRRRRAFALLFRPATPRLPFPFPIPPAVARSPLFPAFMSARLSACPPAGGPHGGALPDHCHGARGQEAENTPGGGQRGGGGKARGRCWALGAAARGRALMHVERSSALRALGSRSLVSRLTLARRSPRLASPTGRGLLGAGPRPQAPPPKPAAPAPPPKPPPRVFHACSLECPPSCGLWIGLTNVALQRIPT